MKRDVRASSAGPDEWLAIPPLTRFRIASKVHVPRPRASMCAKWKTVTDLWIMQAPRKCDAWQNRDRGCC